MSYFILTEKEQRVPRTPVALLARSLVDPRGGSMADVDMTERRSPPARRTASGFALVTTRTDDCAVVSVDGELDPATAPQLADELVALAGAGARSVTVDLAGLTFIDSTGLSVLIDGLRLLRDAEGDLALRSPNHITMKLFEITGLTGVFAITADSAGQ